MPLLPPAVNYHVNRNCNARCRFCFATFLDVPGQLQLKDSLRLLDLLRADGAAKVNFAGGEPTLHRKIGVMVNHAHKAGLVTSIVTNGARLRPLLEQHGGALDWVGLSLDSGDEAVEVALGRSRGHHVAQTIDLAAAVRRSGARLKVNTVVTSLNWREDMSGVLRMLRPDRWKVFQVLPVLGQNDGSVEPLLVTPEEFNTFVCRHAHLAEEGIPAIIEHNDAMRGSYIMIDPLGRFYGNSTGCHIYSAPILEVGVAYALSQVGFESAKFEARGGVYSW